MHPETAKSLWDEATKRVEWLEKELKEIEEELCNSKHCKLCEKVKNIIIKYSDGEPTTADDHNKVYISDVNKEIVDEMNEAIKETPEYKLGKRIFGGDTGIDADYYDENSEKFLKVSK